MEKIFSIIFILLSAITTTAQDILFIGIHSKTEAGKSFWCQDQEMIKAVAKSEEEALKMEKDFKGAFAKQDPVVKLVRTGGVIIYEFQMPMAGFNCSKKAIGWKLGQNEIEARKNLDADKNRMAKEYKATPKELYAWSGLPSNIEEQVININGAEIKFKLIKKNGVVTTTLATIKNTNTDMAMQVIIKTSADAKTQPAAIKLEEPVTIVPQGIETIYTVEPGISLSLNLGSIKEFEIDAVKIKKGPETKQGVINKAKHKFRKWGFEKGFLKERKSTGRTPAPPRA